MDNGIHFLGSRNSRTGMFSTTDLQGNRSQGVLVSNAAVSSGIVQGVDNGVFLVLTSRDRLPTAPIAPTKKKPFNYSLCFTVEYCRLDYVAQVLLRFPVGGNPRPPRQSLTPYIKSAIESNYCLAILFLKEYTNYLPNDSPANYLTVVIRGNTVIYQSREENYITYVDGEYSFEASRYDYEGNNPEEPGYMQLELCFFKKTGNGDDYTFFEPRKTTFLNKVQLVNILAAYSISNIIKLIDYFYD